MYVGFKCGKFEVYVKRFVSDEPGGHQICLLDHRFFLLEFTLDIEEHNYVKKDTHYCKNYTFIVSTHNLKKIIRIMENTNV